MAMYDTGWPWPLDAIQSWFEGLWDNVWHACSWAANQVWQLLPDWIRDGLTFLWNLFSQAGAQVVAFFRDPVGAIGAGLAWVVGQLSPLIDDVKRFLGGLVKAVWDALPEPLRAWTKAAVDNIAAFAKDPVKALKDLVTQMYDKMKPVIDPIAEALNDVKAYFTKAFVDFMKNPLGSIKGLLDPAVSAIGSMFDGAFSAVAEVFRSALAGLAATFEAPFVAVFKTILTMLGGTVSTASPEFFVYAAPKQYPTNLFAGWIYEGLRGVWEWMLKSLTWASEMVVGAVDAVVSTVRGAFNNLFTGLVDTITGAFSHGSPDPQLSRAVGVMVESTWARQVQLIGKMYKSPVSPEDANATARQIVESLLLASVMAFVGGAAIDSAHPFKELMASRTVREIMWFVGVPAVTASIVTLPTAIGLLTPLRYALNEQWMPMQPAANDIIRFAVRECYEPDRLPALLERYPGEEYEKALAREGYSSMWAKFFWGAHWVLPPIESLNAYLYRHDDFKETWRKYIIYHDYIPESVKWLEEVIYPPWTRVDIRRMWDMRTITEDEMYREYRWGGYDDYHAKGLVLWTKVYTALPDLKARFKNGWITADDFKAELIKMGMPSDRAEELLETVTPAVKEERTAKERDLTKGDILALFKVGQISDRQARDMLMGLGYDEMEAGYLVALQSEKMETELKDLTTSQITKAYRYQIFTRDEAKSKLIGAGWSENAAETLLKLEDIKLADAHVDRMRERDLTPAQITRAIKTGIIDSNTGVKYLSYLGYTDWEINVLLKLEGLA